MEHLWAPWRIEYIKKADEMGCIFCQKPAEESDASNYILYRGQKNFIIMNSYPYNPGHLMIAPYRHIANLDELTDKELCEHFELVRRSVSVLRKVFKPDGFNIGMNLGRVAGAGMDKHIHSHIVPRWAGDTNFMPLIAGTDIINEALNETYQKLVGKF
jgi:ATP adenylyltransferase